MSKISKFQQLEGQSFNIKGVDVQVIKYHREVRTSQKTGKKYYAYRLDVQMVGYSNILEISTTSWNKQSFIKRLMKTSVNKVVNNVYNCLPVVYSPIQKTFIYDTFKESWDGVMEEASKLSSIKETRSWFKKYAKYYHPDFLGREQTVDESTCFEVLVETRDVLINEFKKMEEIFGVKLGWFRLILE